MINWDDMDTDSLMSLAERLDKKTTEQEGRIIELESAIRWWYTEHMKNYTDSQYGKAQLKRILNNNPLVAPLE